MGTVTVTHSGENPIKRPNEDSDKPPAPTWCIMQPVHARPPTPLHKYCSRHCSTPHQPPATEAQYPTKGTGATYPCGIPSVPPPPLHIFPTICPITWTSPPSRPAPHPVSTPEDRIQVSHPTRSFPERTRPTLPQSLRTLSVNCVLAGDTQLLYVKARTRNVIRVLSTDILPMHVLWRRNRICGRVEWSPAWILAGATTHCH